jgi:hypothetical protein
MPANAVLFAILAGVALHDSEHNPLVIDGDGRRRDRAPWGKARLTGWTWGRETTGAGRRTPWAATRRRS